MLLTIVTLVFLLLYAALIFFYYVQWNKLVDYQPKVDSPSVFISVIVAARNEEHTLPHLLEDLQRQTYPEDLFEVIIVNDHSTDGTAALSNNFGSRHWQMIQPNVAA